jgi:hypothetical protein
MLSSLLLLVVPFSLFPTAAGLPKSVDLSAAEDVEVRCDCGSATGPLVLPAATSKGEERTVAAVTASEKPLPLPTAIPSINQTSIPSLNGSAPFVNATSKVTPSTGYRNALYFTNWFVLSATASMAGELTISGAFTGPISNPNRYPARNSPTYSMLLLILHPMERCK